MRLCCVQTKVFFSDHEANLDLVLSWLVEASQHKAEFVVFPECMLSGYGFENRQEALGAAIQLSSGHLLRLSEACRRLGYLFIVIGFLEHVKDINGHDKLFNSSVVIGPQGIIGNYRKIHLPHLGVDRFVDRGDLGFPVYKVGDAFVGLGICYDCSFPEPMRLLGLYGADLIAIPTNWPVSAAGTANLVPPVRAMENHLFFAASNRIGFERGFNYCGLSSIHGPDGIELAKAKSDEECLLFADIDVEQARCKRIERTFGCHIIDRFADRRPELYGPISSLPPTRS